MLLETSMMKTTGITSALFALAGIVSLSIACGSSTAGTCEETSSCTPGTDGGNDGSSGGQDGSVDAPPGCDPKADPKDAPACVVSEFAVFVDGKGGNDGNAGTKDSPVKTIGAALGKLAGKPRIYVCEGTYDEHVKLTSAVSIYGGWACGAWSYSGAKARVAPTDPGAALEVRKTGAPIELADLEVHASDAADPGGTSLAVLLSESAEVMVRRSRIVAGAGRDALDAAPPPTNLYSANISDLEGNAAVGTSGGGAKTCACKVYGVAVGGSGGNGANGNGNSGSSTPSATAIAPDRDGAGGAGGAGSCSSGHSGGDGAARTGGAGATVPGTLSAQGWIGTAGRSGDAGNPGQGGGGGGARANGGGGGGCGGCGGNGGVGGAAGGSSIAIAAFKTPLVLQASELETGRAGKGGNGSTGETGGGGGGGGGGNVGACGGGDGGNGAGGGGGGGGAGGVSVAIVYSGTAPALGAETNVKLGAPGSGGGRGEGGAGGVNPNNGFPPAVSGQPGSKGIDGTAAKTLEVQ
jgi:hypothetical protein